jgi:hypothetical protein
MMQESSEDLYTGLVPEGFTLPRDESPLPAGALLRFQTIARGNDVWINHRWVLYRDGRLYLAWNTGHDNYETLPFDTELPIKPTKVLDRDSVNAVEMQLRESGFLNQPPYQLDTAVEDGTFYIVTARIDGMVHEVIYEAYEPPLIDFLYEIGNAAHTSAD